MYYIVGLGNPGEQYQDTPHNIGWHVVDEIQRQNAGFSPWVRDSYLQSEVSRGEIDGSEVLLFKPQTFMNKSGEIFRHLDLDIEDPESVIVIYDDIDIPFGKIKLAKNRGSGGHNGIKNIEQHLKTRSFIRFRVGVCPLDWFGNPRKPQGRDAVSRYLTAKKLSPRYSAQYADIALEIVPCVKRIIGRGYNYAISTIGSR